MQAQHLFTQPNVDARSAEASIHQMLGQHDQASSRMLQVMLDVGRLRSPDQRKQISEGMSQRQSMMRRNRAERDALKRTAKCAPRGSDRAGPEADLHSGSWGRLLGSRDARTKLP